jgi:hypothetical protein
MITGKMISIFSRRNGKGKQTGMKLPRELRNEQIVSKLLSYAKDIYNTSVTIVLAPMTIAVYKTFLQAVETQNCSLLLKLNFVKNPNLSQNSNPSPSPTREIQLGFFG